MFGKSKDNDQAAAPSPAAKVAEPPAARPTAPAPPAVALEVPEATSSISSGMTVVGKIAGDGIMKVFGRIEGELQATSVTICEGAHVEGNVTAQDLTVGGTIKGTIHALRVKLSGTAFVEGDIYHRSLTIEENARFEGSSRREDGLLDKPLGVQGKDATSQPPPAGVLIESNGKFNGQPDNNGLYKAAE